MNIIKDGKVVPTDWQFVDEIESLTGFTKAVVTAKTLLNADIEKLDVLGLGVFIDGDDQLDDLIPYLSKIDLVVIAFPSFTDGRGFSTAYRLRNSIGYDGEIWAKGNLIADQYSQALQCGIDGVVIDDLQIKRQPIDQWKKALEVAPLPYRFENNIGQLYHRSKKKPFHLTSANDNSDEEIVRLNQYFSDKPTEELLNYVLIGRKMGRVALVSSFGTQSSVLLHLVASIDPQVPVLFIDTGKLFPQTLQFQKDLAAKLNLTNVKSVRQDNSQLNERDGDGNLWNSDNRACCDLRKVEPLKNQLSHFDSWISGRKIFQGGMRGSLNLFEKSGNHIKINPLAKWSQDQMKAYINRFNLPVHPLVDEGYSSVGCMPCTTPVAHDQSSRAGRWAGTEKTECGIHLINDTSANKANSRQRQTG